MKDENNSSNFKAGESGGNFNFANGDSYLVTYHWIGILTIKIMSLRKVVYKAT